MKETKPISGLTSDIVTDKEVLTVSPLPPELPPDEDGAFTDGEARDINTIMLMRIYDLLGAILEKLDPEESDIIQEAHEHGKFVGHPPSINL